MTETIQKTCLCAEHEELHARMMDFHGWWMPIQYSGILEEHNAVRTRAGMFDISHMGQIYMSGRGAWDDLQNLCTNDLEKRPSGFGVYSLFCDEKGGVLDDLFVYRKDMDHFFVVVNASTQDADVEWMTRHLGSNTSLQHLRGRGGIALQGPEAFEIASDLYPAIESLPRFGAREVAVNGDTLWACRTGYTGEDGVEFFGPEKAVIKLWRELLKQNVTPCGLGARDTLRLEMGYPLYGQDLTPERTPLEARLAWAIGWKKKRFIGKEVIDRQREKGPETQLVGFRLTERGIPRQGSPVFAGDKQIALVTSGTFSPSLKAGIGMAYLPSEHARAGDTIWIGIHGKKTPATITPLPFYRPAP